MHKEVFDVQTCFSHEVQVLGYLKTSEKKVSLIQLYFSTIHNWKGSLKMLHTLTFK